MQFTAFVSAAFALKKSLVRIRYPEYESATIPTLREVYELLKLLGLNVNTELKTSRIRYEQIEEKCVKLAADMLIGDYPDRMARIRAEMQGT